MYEIWLIINTFYELALANLGLVLGVIIVWAILMGITWQRKSKPWGAGVKPALLAAVAVWIISFMLIPSMTKSSFANVTYILDWLVVAGVAAAIAALTAAFIGPIYLLLTR